MNMYEKMFRHNGNVVVKMDELTNVRRSMYLEAIRRLATEAGAIGMYVYGHDNTMLYAVRLTKRDVTRKDIAPVTFDERWQALRMIHKYIKYAVPYRHIHHIMLSNQVPARDVESLPRYVLAPIYETNWKDVDNLLPWLSRMTFLTLDDRIDMVKHVLGPMDDQTGLIYFERLYPSAVSHPRYNKDGKDPSQWTDDEIIDDIATKGIDAWHKMARITCTTVPDDVVRHIHDTIHALAEALWTFWSTGFGYYYEHGLIECIATQRISLADFYIDP